MFSDVNKVTEKLPIASDKRAYQSDTREEIRRHDPDQEQRKKGRRFAEEQAMFGDDRTEISLNSLEAFLPMLLKNYAAQPQREAFSVDDARQFDQAIPSARAAGAYARMAEYANPVGVLREKVKESTARQDKDIPNDNPTLSKEEVKIIHQLQKDVKTLRTKGIETLSINKSGSILEGLQAAIQDAL